jgi:2-oxoglutarate ferredoxin oxidoreductase subunit alpha
LTKTNGELFTPDEILKSIIKTWIQITEMWSYFYF